MTLIIKRIVEVRIISNFTSQTISLLHGCGNDILFNNSKQSHNIPQFDDKGFFTLMFYLVVGDFVPYQSKDYYSLCNRA